MSGNRVVDLAALAGLVHLRVLVVSGNAVTDLGPLTHLGMLENLGLAGTAVSDVTALQDLAALRRLDLGGHRGGRPVAARRCRFAVCGCRCRATRLSSPERTRSGA